MTKTQNLRIVRPTTGADGKISAYSMVKALMNSGCDMKGTKLAAELTDTERAELGL